MAARCVVEHGPEVRRPERPGQEGSHAVSPHLVFGTVTQGIDAAPPGDSRLQDCLRGLQIWCIGTDVGEGRRDDALGNIQPEGPPEEDGHLRSEHGIVRPVGLGNPGVGEPVGSHGFHERRVPGTLGDVGKHPQVRSGGVEAKRPG